MSEQNTEKRVARISYEANGYVISNDAADYIDATGPSYPSQAMALRAADRYDYTHYVTNSGKISRIPTIYRNR